MSNIRLLMHKLSAGNWVPIEDSDFSKDFADITNRPTTLSGFGITDGASLNEDNYFSGTISTSGVEINGSNIILNGGAIEIQGGTGNILLSGSLNSQELVCSGNGAFANVIVSGEIEGNLTGHASTSTSLFDGSGGGFGFDGSWKPAADFPISSYGGTVIISSSGITNSGAFTNANNAVFQADVQIDGLLEVYGTSYFQGNSNFAGDVTVESGNLFISSGNLEVASDFSVNGESLLNGHVTLGNSSAQDVYFNGSLRTSIIPAVTNSFDLGSATLKFKNGWFEGDINISSGSVFISSGELQVGGDLLVGGESIFNGHVSLGNNNVDDIVFNGSLTGSIVPKTTNVSNLGSTTLRFKDGWFQGVVTAAGGFSGGASSFFGIDVVSGLASPGSIKVGADVNSLVRTSNVRKLASFTAPDFTNTKSVEFFNFDSPSASFNIVNIGGRPSGSQYAVTNLNFVTASNTSSTGGTARLTIDGDGQTRLTNQIASDSTSVMTRELVDVEGLWNLSRVRQLGAYAWGTSGAGSSAAEFNGMGSSSLASGTSNSGYGRATIARGVTGPSSFSGQGINFSRPITVSCLIAIGSLPISSNCAIRLIVGGNRAVPAAADANAISSRGFGWEIGWNSVASRADIRTFAYEGSYTTSSWHNASFGNSNMANIIISSDGAGNISLYVGTAVNSAPRPSSTPVLTQTGGPTSLIGASDGIDVAAVNSTTGTQSCGLVLFSAILDAR